MEDNKYYCPWCDWFIDADEVYGIEDNDQRHKGCGKPVDSEPDPPYDHTGHDTLEEKNS